MIYIVIIQCNHNVKQVFYKFYQLNSIDLPVMTQPTDSFEEIDSAVVRFAGDSGDCMQTVGERFTYSSAFACNDIADIPLQKLRQTLHGHEFLFFLQLSLY